MLLYSTALLMAVQSAFLYNCTTTATAYLCSSQYHSKCAHSMSLSNLRADEETLAAEEQSKM